jgi:hypothetical protein
LIRSKRERYYAGLKKEFQPLTIISSQEINNNVTVLDTREVIGEDLTSRLTVLQQFFKQQMNMCQAR